MSENAEKSRIFCVITQGELGGAQEFVHSLASHLDRERFTLHVVWGSDSHPALAHRLPAWVTHAVAQNLVRPVRPLKDLAATRELRAMMRRFRPDTVLLVSSKAGYVGARAAHGLRTALPGLRVVYRIGGWSFNDPNPGWKKALYRWAEKRSARWKDFIVLNNSHDLDQARALNIRPRGKLVRIFNGIDPYTELPTPEQAWGAVAARIPDASRHAKTDFVVGTVANLYPAKDIANLIKAASRISENVRFVVIGEGDQRGMLERLIADYELGDRFFLVGRLADAAKLMPAFDVFALPSAKEGFPWALLEAMAAKVPVVATRVGAVPEMIEDGKSGIVVPPNDPDALAQGIVRLLGDERLRRELAIQAHQQVLSRFTLREMISQYERLFTS